jgi:group I intron endonuclease
MKYLIENKNQSGIYQISNSINDKIYIGSAFNLYKRFKQHVWALKNNKHHNNQLSNFTKKYSLDVLKFEIIEFVEVTLLEEKEQYYIDKYKENLFNESYDVKSFNRNKKLSLQHKQNISNALKKYIQTPEHRENINKSLKGKAGKYTRTEELRDNLRDKIKKNKERGEKISESLKGRKVTWVNHSQETKKKIGEKNKNNNIKPIIQYSLNDEYIKEWNSISDAAAFINPNNIGAVRSAISDCLRGKTKKSNGYKWKYKNTI